MQIKTFSKSQVALPLPYLLHVQRAAWNTFWERDVKELFAEISPIRDYTGKELELWFLDYKLDEPKYKDYLEAKINDDSFEATLRARTRLVNLKTKEIKEQEVFLVDFPLMTEQGFFVVNGVERVIISQLIRSPGSFFTAAQSGGKNYFGAKIIPNRGSWLEFETEASGFIGVKIDRKRKVAATCLLRALGIENEQSMRELFSDVNNGDINFIEETLKKDPTKTQADALVEIYQRLRPGDVVTPENAKELIWNMFFNFERYDLSRVGRWRTLQRLPELIKIFQKNKKETSIKKEEVTVKDRVLKLED